MHHEAHYFGDGKFLSDLEVLASVIPTSRPRQITTYLVIDEGCNWQIVCYESCINVGLVRACV